VLRQAVEGVPIRGALTKNVLNRRGEVSFAWGKSFSEPPSDLAQRIRSQGSGATLILARMRKQLPELSSALWSSGPRMEIVAEAGWRLVWVMDFVGRGSDGFKTAMADEQGNLIHLTSAGMQFVDGLATVFPKGPKQSELSEVTLKGLVGDGRLHSSRIVVSGTKDPKAWAADHIFRYSPENAEDDARFDEVQAFFYVSNMMDWLKQRGGLELPFALDVQVGVLSNDKPSNSAFYYQGNIRLGSGDGKKFWHMPRDPSIVAHETAHAYIDMVAGLATQGSGGSLNEGYADFLTASFLGSPHMGEVAFLGGPYRRTLQNEMTLPQANGSLYHDSLIMSGALWEIHQKIGPESALALALKSLARLPGANPTLSDFGTACLFSLREGFSPVESKRIEAILESRGLLPTAGKSQ